VGRGIDRYYAEYSAFQFFAKPDDGAYPFNKSWKAMRRQQSLNWLGGFGHEKHFSDIRNIFPGVARPKGTGPSTLRTAIATAEPLDPNHE